jgi:hypothetical protein
MANPDEGIAVPIVLAGFEDLPVLMANHFIIQHEVDQFILAVGQLVPPPLIGTEEEQREQALQLTSVSVKIVARLAMTRTRVEELIGILQGNLQRYDARKGRQ